MNPISKTLIQHILEEETSSVGVFGGGFKPPTKGHFAVVEKILNNYNINKLIIFVGSGVRDNISQQQSLDIWNVYKKYLPKKVEIVPSQVPITSIYDYAKENPNTEVKWFLGAREENIQDRVDFEKRTKSAASKPNLTPILITTPLEISGTKTRQSLQNKEEFFTYLPDMLSDSDKETVYSILSGINEWVPEPEIDNIEDYADDVLNPLDLKIPPHFVDRVNDRRNNPSIEADELYDFFDKLSDEKDDLEDLLDDEGEIVATDSDTNINIPLAKDNERINTVVAKTIMRKKNFLTPNKKLVFEEDFFEPLEDDVDDERVNFYTEYYKNLSPSEFQVEKQKDKVVISNISKKKLEHNSEFKKLLVSLTMYMMDHINIDPLPNVEFVEDDSKNANDLLGKTAYYDPNNQTIVLYTYNRHPKDVLRSYAHEMIHHKQNLEGKIQNIKGQNINEDEYLKELEAEAYLQGNGLLFRGWENSLKND
jgi:nicotinic acid mononucleotide adenylyltransferase